MRTFRSCLGRRDLAIIYSTSTSPLIGSSIGANLPRRQKKTSLMKQYAISITPRTVEVTVTAARIYVYTSKYDVFDGCIP